MALNIEAHRSTRLNRIEKDQRVTLCDYNKKQAFGLGTLVGWSINGKPVDAPKSMKSMDPGIELTFTNVVNLAGESQDDLKLVLEPGAYGAMFIATTTGEGENTKTTYRRVTAYESLADIQKRVEAKQEVTAPEVVEPTEEVAEEKPKARSSRKGKKAEVQE